VLRPRDKADKGHKEEATRPRADRGRKEEAICRRREAKEATRRKEEAIHLREGHRRREPQEATRPKVDRGRKEEVILLREAQEATCPRADRGRKQEATLLRGNQEATHPRGHLHQEEVILLRVGQATLPKGVGLGPTLRSKVVATVEERPFQAVGDNHHMVNSLLLSSGERRPDSSNRVGGDNNPLPIVVDILRWVTLLLMAHQATLLPWAILLLVVPQDIPPWAILLLVVHQDIPPWAIVLLTQHME